MHECDRIRSFLSGYLEGDLSQELYREVEAHLTICSECNETALRIRALCLRLRKLPVVTTSSDFESRLQQQIASLNNKSARVPFPGFQGWKTPLMASAAVLASIGLFFLFSQGGSSGKPPGYIEQSGVGNLRQSVPQPSVRFQNSEPAAAMQPEQVPVGVKSNEDSLKRKTEQAREQGMRLVGDQ